MTQQNQESIRNVTITYQQAISELESKLKKQQTQHTLEFEESDSKHLKSINNLKNE